MPTRRKTKSPQERIVAIIGRARDEAAVAGIKLDSVWVDPSLYGEVLRAFAFPLHETRLLKVEGVPVKKFEFVATT